MASLRSRRQLKRQADDDAEIPVTVHPSLRALRPSNAQAMDSMRSSPSSASSCGAFNMSSWAADFPLCANCEQCFCISDTVSLSCNHALCRACFHNGCTTFPTNHGMGYGIHCPMCQTPSSWNSLPANATIPSPSSSLANPTITASPSQTGHQTPASTMAVKPIMQALRALRKVIEPPVEVELVEGNLMNWIVRFKDPSLELLVSFPSAYPDAAPLVRLLQPACLQHSQLVTSDGAVCLASMLARDGGWTSSANLPQLLLAAHAQLIEALGDLQSVDAPHIRSDGMDQSDEVVSNGACMHSGRMTMPASNSSTMAPWQSQPTPFNFMR
eukprot:TRINITY_DN12416_c3_g1_i1.p1 TRINITY_DN12416_c3_g1~~TRINITY_DN12416_c3_g1_i1.p1  ORF type:complete len:351 (+),score=38.23 TRINITY_DN12416_c3_g1_i1:71-1054(+)